MMLLPKPTEHSQPQKRRGYRFRFFRLGIVPPLY